MASITSACTCSVDGVSGHANTRYNDYSFTGCGAHVEYKLDGSQGLGYDRTWCYVTSPDDCPGEDPYIPEGLKDDHTLPEWKEAGAAWKDCYDGYRCEAWWGSLSGQLEGDPVVLKAPLDWPDCCALCSDNNNNGTTTAACAGWSFHPATGSCQLMSDVSLGRNVSTAWGVNSTVNGYPGYFEAPVTGCWVRTGYGLCSNMNLGLLIPGVIFAFFGLCLCVCLSGVITPLAASSLLRELLDDWQSRLRKASCVEVSATRWLRSTGKGGSTYTNVYEGTFMTRDGTLFVVPEIKGKATAHPYGRLIEQKLLDVLFTKNVNPLADHGVAARCQTAQGLRSEYLSILRNRPRILRSDAPRSIRRREQVGGSYDLDCLLFVGGSHSNREHPPARKVLLVGILGEDRLTCIDADILEAFMRVIWMGGVPLALATTLLTIFCVTLLTNKAAQLMAVWTFPGTDFRTGAVIGLALCLSIPFALLAYAVYVKATMTRLIQQYPPATEELSESPPAENVPCE